VLNYLFEDLQKEGFQVYGCADDIAILVGENLLDTVRDLPINALKILQRWYETKGLTVNQLKTDVIVFTRKCKPEPKEPLRQLSNFIKYRAFHNVLHDYKHL
jgi:hypothetical protein